MGASGRSYASVGAALALAGAVAAAPIAPQAPEIPIVGSALQLAAGESILNIPVNLLFDLISVPADELNGLQIFADSGFFSGSWMVPSATNLWGSDPGDIGHYYALANMLVPFPVLADGIAAQFAGYAEAEFPVSPWCDAQSCLPIFPASPITGITPIDQLIWGGLIVTGLTKFPLTDNWFQVPISQLLSGYTFTAADDPGYYDPSGPAYANAAWPTPEIPAGVPPGPFAPTTTVTLPDGQTAYEMPWANTTFTLDPTKPLTDFLNSLVAAPSSNSLQLVDPLAVIQTIQSLLASLVIDFDPFTPGTLLCPLGCNLPEPLTIPGIVSLIGSLPAGNPQIDAWLAAWQTHGTAHPDVNWATPEQIGLEQGYLSYLFNLDLTDANNPGWPPFGSMPATPPAVDAAAAAGTASADLSALWADLVGSL